MNVAFYTGKSGLRAHQESIDIISHNLVNANTYGYKATKGEFRALLHSTMDINKNRELEDDEKILRGHGVKLSNQDLLFTQGPLQSTDYEFDFAIEGDGLFAVDNRGDIEYTRNGSFNLSNEGGTLYLVAEDGAYVLDNNYNRIIVPYKPGTNVADSSEIADRLGLFTFSNAYGLRRLNEDRFETTDISGEAEIAPVGERIIAQHYLERSNTDVAQQFADVIVSQKAYQFSARVVTTADEIEQIVNSLRK